MTDELDRLDALAAAATPGPWIADFPDGAEWSVFAAAKPGNSVLAFDVGEHNAAYIAACDPDTIRRLIAAAPLGVAWDAAEAALPEGWVLELASPNLHEPRPTFRAEAWNGNGGVTRGFVKADDLTGPAALDALAVALRERKP